MTWTTQVAIAVNDRKSFKQASALASTDSDLEAFSRNPTDDSFASVQLVSQTQMPWIRNNGSSRTELYYYGETLQNTTTHQQGKTNLSHDGLNPAHVPYQWVNNPTLGEFCFAVIGRADIEGSKSRVALNALPPQASYPFGNFSDTSRLIFQASKGSLGHAFTVFIHTEDSNQEGFYPYILLEISVLDELPLGRRRYCIACVPPQPNSPPDNVFDLDLLRNGNINTRSCVARRASTQSNKQKNDRGSGISRLPKLPLILHPLCFFTKSDQSQAQQGLLSPLILQSPFPLLWFRQIVDRDSGNLVNPFMRVTNQMTRHLATLRESQLLPPFTRAWLNFFTLTFRALGRNHIASTPFSGHRNAMFQLDSQIPLVRTSSKLVDAPSGREVLTANPQSQSFFQRYGSILPTSLTYIILSTRGYSPWRPAAVMSTTEDEMIHSLGFSRAVSSAPDKAIRLCSSNHFAQSPGNLLPERVDCQKEKKTLPRTTAGVSEFIHVAVTSISQLWNINQIPFR
ncbi:hypothetical protein MP228_011642 [Amoeboaphelidium protococcarum]|nr:hypothetical protein MP228_011642 [Amoeboaphelidium protococcarum]